MRSLLPTIPHHQACNYGPPSSSRKSVPARTRALAPKANQQQSSGSEYPSNSVSSSQSESEWDWKGSLPRSLSAEMLDPFETHPESKVAGIDVLMKHCSLSHSSTNA